MPKYKNLILWISLFFSINLHSQTRATLKGKVLDSLTQSPLEYATVCVSNLKDSTLISYTLTVKDGIFELKNLPTLNTLKLLISFVGYNAHKQNLKLGQGEIRNIGTVNLQGNILNEVIVRGERLPVSIKRDTIEFSPEAFKTRPNAVLEDLLKKLPGLQVDVNGTISVNGKKILKITIEGKDYFANDLTIASKNINVDLIDKVQLLDDRENDPDRLKDESQVDKVINIKLKKNIKRSIFGKMYAGAGSANRFETGGLINIFRDTLQVSLIGFGNNINSTAFTDSDLGTLGGFRRSGTNTSSSGGGTSGLQKIGSGGINLNYDIKSKTKLSLMYFYGNTTNKFATIGQSETFIRDTTQNSAYNYNNQDASIKHTINGLGHIQFNKETYLRYTPKVAFHNFEGGNSRQSSNSNNYQGVLINSINNNEKTDKSFQYEHALLYYHRFKRKNESLSITNTLRFNPRDLNTFILGRLQYYLPINRDSLQRQTVERQESNNSAKLELYYRSPLAKNLIADFTTSGTLENGIRSIGAYRFNPVSGSYDLYLADFSNNLRRDLNTFIVRSGITWNFQEKRTLRAAAVVQLQKAINEFEDSNTNISNTYLNVFPSIRYSSARFTASYDVNNRQPEISDLQLKVLPENALYTFVGNPNLTPSITHNLRIRYNKFIPSSQVNYLAYGWINYDRNTIIYSSTIKNGETVETPLNINGNYNSYGSVQFSKQFKQSDKWQLQVSANIGNYLENRVFLQNSIRDQQLYNETKATIGFSVDWNKKVYIEPSYAVMHKMNIYRVEKSEDKNFYQHNLNTQILLNFSPKLTIEVNNNFLFDQQIHSNYDKTNNLLNGSIAYNFLKDNRSQLKLTGFDILDQNTGIGSYIGNNTFSTERQLVLHRYFLFSFVYNFSKTLK